MKTSLWLRLPVTLMVVIATIVVSIIPGDRRYGQSSFVWLLDVTSPNVQNFMHFIVYASLAWLWTWTLESKFGFRRGIVVSLIICVALGTSLELIQMQIPGRFGSFFDILTNAAGSVAGLLLAHKTMKQKAT